MADDKGDIEAMIEELRWKQPGRVAECFGYGLENQRVPATAAVVREPMPVLLLVLFS